MPGIDSFKISTGEYLCPSCNYKRDKKQLFQTHLNSKKHKNNVSNSKSQSSPNSQKSKEVANKNLEKLNQIAKELQESRDNRFLNDDDDDDANTTDYTEITTNRQGFNNNDDPFGENFTKQFSGSAFSGRNNNNNTVNERNMDIALNLSGPPIKPGSGFEVQLSKQIKEQMDKYHPNPNFEGVMPEEEVPYQRNHIWTIMFDSDSLELHPYQQESYEYFTDKYDFLPSKIRQAIFQDVKTLLAFNTLYNVPDYLG